MQKIHFLHFGSQQHLPWFSSSLWRWPLERETSKPSRHGQTSSRSSSTWCCSPAGRSSRPALSRGWRAGRWWCQGTGGQDSVSRLVSAPLGSVRNISLSQYKLKVGIAGNMRKIWSTISHCKGSLPLFVSWIENSMNEELLQREIIIREEKTRGL